MSLLFFFVGLAAGQDIILPVIPRQIPRRVGIVNESPTPGPWVVYELKMFFSTTCDEADQLQPSPSDVYDTGTRRETELFTSGPFAFDGRTWTNWTADCMVQLGGCLSRTVGIGVDITYTEAYALALEERESQWTVLGPLLDAITVKCVHIFQSSDPLHKADDITIVDGFLDVENDEYTYEVVQTFLGVSGGGWSRRPPPLNYLWRLQNVQVTLGPWSLSELQFFEDELCTWQMNGLVYSLGSQSPMAEGELKAFDGDVSTVWTAKCDPIPGSDAPEIWGDGLRFDGCEPEQAFIGLEFDSERTVRCVRLFQRNPVDLFEREQRRSWTAGFALQRWTGNDWKTEEQFWDKNVPYGLFPPTLDTPFIGDAPGVWEDMRPPNKTCWRLSNDDYTRGQWNVLELEFYTSEFCADLPDARLEGTPLSMQGPGNMEIYNVYDGDLRQDLVWTSSCSQGLGRDSCIPGEAWLGIYVRGRQPDVKCIRILQSKTLDEQSAFVSLHVYLNGGWSIHSQHPEIGGGTWNRRPAPPWTLWRVRNNNQIAGQWQVAEIRAFRDPLCLVQMTPGRAIGSGYFAGDEPAAAFDEDAATVWTANCDSCNETRRYWVGQELPPDAEDAQAGQDMVRCFRVWQSERLERQMVSVQVQIWNGEIYTMSPVTDTGSMHELGGGVWSRPTASFMTRWRLLPNVPDDRLWRLLEIELYADTACKHRLGRSGSRGGGISVLASSYLGFVPYFDRVANGKMWSEAEQLNDLDTTRGLLVEHKPSQSRPGFVGVDFLSSSVWVRCVKLMQGSMPLEYVPSVRLELWDGKEWRSEDPEMSPVEVQLDGLGGGGWQRRPAQPGSMWRVENADVVPEGWAVYEVEFFTNSDCSSGRLVGDVIASGYVPPMEDRGPEHAFDGNTSTIWMSQCCPVEIFHHPIGFETVQFRVGCNASDAWIGLDLGETVVQNVRCARIFQAGYELMQSGTVDISKWDGTNWAKHWQMGGLGGSEWNRRPAAINTMWRLQYLSRKDEPCPTQLARIMHRPWGISDLKLFSDDTCQTQITGGTPITSGSFDFFSSTTVDQPSYASSRIVDEDPLTTWAANCRTGFNYIATEKTDCTGAWVGMQWSVSYEVRCVKIVQSRWESARCCDAADVLELQRWNGSNWVEASWFREPPQPAIPTQYNMRAPVHLGAEFRNVGECPSRLSGLRIFEQAVVEQRSRKDSEKCIVKLTGAVPLLAEPYCIKHPKCVDVFGASGTCCPIGDLIQSENRCCCSFMGGEPIFADETSITDTRDKLSFEYATIWMSNVLPWLGLGVTIALYLAAVLLPADAESRAKYWVRSDIGSRERHARKRLFLKRMVVVPSWPLLAWRSFLATSKSETSKIIRWFILPNGRNPRPLELYRSLLFLVLGSVLSGMAPWLLLGAIFGEMMIGCALQLCQVIRYFKSPFDPLDLRDMHLRQEVSRVKVKHDDGMASAMDVATNVAATFVFGLAYFGKFIFDLLIVRAQMLSFEAIDNIEADRVVELFPGLLETLREPAMLLYDMMYATSQAISWSLGRLVGIPLCEGSCALAGSVALVMILYGASQWLNYDLFGLFVGARQVVRATRPECQRVLAQSLILFCLSASFAAVQMTMVLFTRALAFANPFVVSTWVCEYDDTLAIFVGRLLLTGSSLVGLIFVFLCVNGHFMGQDYITERVANFLGIDLTALDPDGVGEEGGMFRLNVFGAAMPTLFGVWWDPWNIDAYLVHERAHVYSMELRDPQACKRCEKIHVQYELMMTATGRTVSAAVQIVPYGAVVAKACEYLNDPPLVYIGNKMSCLKMRKLERYPAPRKKNVILRTYMLIAEILAYSVEYLVPFLRRLTSVGMLLYLSLGTFTLTENNLAAQGTYVIIAGFTLSFVKASLERIIPALLKYGLTGIYFALSSAEGKVHRANNLARTITGQVLSGSLAASYLSGSLISAGWASLFDAIIISSSLGYAFSLITLIINAALEDSAPEVGDPPKRKSMMQLVGKIIFALLTGGALGAVLLYAGEAGLWWDNPVTDVYNFKKNLGDGDRWTVRDSIGLSFIAVAIQFLVLRVILVENQQPINEQVEREAPWRRSPTRVVLRSMYFFPGIAAIPTCTLIATFLTEWLAVPLNLSPLYKQFLLSSIGIVLANISGLTIHRLMDSFPQLMGFFACVLSACVLCPWNFLFGAFTAVWIGVAVGSILEEVILRRTLQREIKRREATGEDDMAFFDHKRAACMEEWEKLEDEDTASEQEPEPGREDKLQTLLEIAAAGQSPIDYVREASGDYALEPEPPLGSGSASHSGSDLGESMLADGLESETQSTHGGLLSKKGSWSSGMVEPPPLPLPEGSDSPRSQRGEVQVAREPSTEPVEAPKDSFQAIKDDASEGRSGDADAPELRDAAADEDIPVPMEIVVATVSHPSDIAPETQDGSNSTIVPVTESAIALPGEIDPDAAKLAEEARREHLQAAASRPAAEVNPVLRGIRPQRQDLWSRVHGARQPRAVPSLRPTQQRASSQPSRKR
ncbi:unnamed protein product [Effrenium voratum]|nr:unnamed protein product [Effrenium voratum]